MTNTRNLSVLAAFSSLVSLQFGAAFAKTIFPVAGPEGAAALRIGFAALILGVAFRPWRLSVPSARWPNLIAYGAMIGAMNLLIYRAFLYLPVGIAISIQVIGPLGAALLASRRRIDLLWIGCAVSGLAILRLGKTSGALDPRGLPFVSAAAVCWGIYVTVGSKVADLGGRAVATGMAIAAALVVPIGFFRAGHTLLQPRLLASGMAVATLSSALPFLLDIYALKRLPRSVFGVLMSASPAVSAFASLVILDERLSLVQWVGIGSITLACVGTSVFSAANGQRGSHPSVRIKWNEHKEGDSV